MAMELRTFDEMVESVLNNIVISDTGITDIGKGSVVRTLVEAIMSELDIMYYQTEKVYNDCDPKLAEGDDLDRLVSILGVTRNQPTYATGTCRFMRSSPAISDIPIPAGTVVSTREDDNGNIMEFSTIADAILLAGDTQVDVQVKSISAGYRYIDIGKLCVMNVPIIGIESVTNTAIIDDGTDVESDRSLRIRSTNALSSMGKGTVYAIQGALMEVDGVRSVKVIDMARGLGTVDVIISCNGSDVFETASQVALDVKPAGVDINISSPRLLGVNINVNIIGATKTEELSRAGEGILEYVNTLGIGDTLYLSQLYKYILTKLGDNNLDVQIIQPTGNIIPSGDQIISLQTSTVGGITGNPVPIGY